MAFSEDWLKSPSAIRIILVHVKALKLGNPDQEENFYFSNGGYTTSDGKQFNPLLIGAFGFQESISPDGSSSMSIGDIEIHNLNGEYDDLLDNTKYIWSNCEIKIYFGDPGWSASLSTIPSVFYTIFNGIIDDIDSRSNTTINFKIRDRLELINSPISENKIGTYGVWVGGQQNKETLRPIVFGEVFNISPVSIDPSTYEYCFGCSNPAYNDPTQVSTFDTNGASERLIEVRDNGMPIYRAAEADKEAYNNAAVELEKSTFKLTYAPQGTITCSVQGVKMSMDLTTGDINENLYVNNIPSIIGVILQKFGKAGSRFTKNDIDLPSFSQFNTQNPNAAVGIYITDAQDTLEVCKSLAASVGGQLVVGREGKIKLVQFGDVNALPSVASTTITTSDILYDSLNISQRLAVISAKKIGYAKNYTIQTGLLTFVPSEHKEAVESEWLTTGSIADDTLITKYKLQKEAEQVDTYLISTAGAQAEVTRLKNYYSQQRTVYSFTGTARLLRLVLGQKVTLIHHRFGLSGGKIGQVVSLRPNWNKDQIEVEVMI